MAVLAVRCVGIGRFLWQYWLLDVLVLEGSYGRDF